jgi:hypothetical protein
LLSIQFDIQTNLSVKDGKLKASASESVIFRTLSMKTHIFEVIKNYLGIFQSLLDMLNKKKGSKDL